MRNNFVFYTSYYECIKELPEEVQGEIYKAIIEYAMEQKEPKLTGISSGIFKLIKPTLDKSYQQYENGIKGGRPKPTANPNQTQEETHDVTQTVTQEETQDTTQTVSNKNLDKNKKNNQEIIKQERKIKQKETTVLTDSEVIAYIQSHIKNDAVCQKFIDYVNNRKAMGKKYAIRTQATLDINIGNLKKWATTVEEAINILEYSIANNYQGLFNPKREKTPQAQVTDKERVTDAEAVAWKG